MGGCPIAESVAIRLITLPNYAALKEREIDNIAELFRAALRDYRSKVAQADFDGPLQIHFEYPLGGANSGSRNITIPREEVFGQMKQDLGKVRGYLAQANL